MLSLKQIQDICLSDDTTHRRCRYLSQDENDDSKFYCMKLSSKAQDIDSEITNYLVECQKRNRDPLKENLPLGDNCSGYPMLRHLEQGYDCD
jgi:hypothetical protein